jgi:hypothetical protein
VAARPALQQQLPRCRSPHPFIYSKSLPFPAIKYVGSSSRPRLLRFWNRSGSGRSFFDSGRYPSEEQFCILVTAPAKASCPDGAFGLSRYEFDRLLFEKAIALGATTTRERVAASNCAPQGGSQHRDCLILATGRKSNAAAGRRLFGFKAHFEGPTNDAVELFFFRGCYVGVSAIENGTTNICGIAPEHVLRACEFHADDLLSGWPPLACRVRPLSRVSRWFTVGPLVFGGQWQHFAGSETYPVGGRAGLHRSVHRAGFGERSGYRSRRWIGRCQAEFGRGLPVQLSPCGPQAFLSGQCLPCDPGSRTGAGSGPVDSCPLPLSNDALRRPRRVRAIEFRME